MYGYPWTAETPAADPIASLRAARVKQALRTASAPLALVVSIGVGESVRSGRIGQAGGLVSVEVAGRWHQGLIQTLGRAG
jgi:hypothetical protein